MRLAGLRLSIIIGDIQSMNKSAIALAVMTTASAAAIAQSSVTLYGKIDVGLVVDGGNPAGKSVRLASGETAGSRIGFKGVEDLGGGYKAAFQIETGFCSDSAAGAPNFCTGSNQFMGRQDHGDLSGPFGSISAGRQYSLDYTNIVTVDPFGTGLAGDVQDVIGDKTTIRLNNDILYTTPSFAGMTVSAEMALGETTGNFKAGREFGGAIVYTHGPLFVDLTLFDVDNTNGAGVARKAWQLGAIYDFGVVKVHALGISAKGSPTGAQRPLDAVDMLLGVTVPVAGGSLLANYARHDDRTALTAPGGGDRDASQWAIGYIYPLSKRTSAYTAYGRIDNEHGATYTVGNATENGTGNKAFNLGMVHNF